MTSQVNKHNDLSENHPFLGQQLTSQELNNGGVWLNNPTTIDPKFGPLFNYGFTFGNTEELARINSKPEIKLDEGVELSSQEKRAKQLEALPTEGLSPESHRKLAEYIAAIGLPVDALTMLRFERNGKGNENTLGSIGRRPNGEGSARLNALTIYELGAKQPANGFFELLSHELMHSVSPLKSESLRFYQSIEQQKEIAESIIRVGELAGITGVDLNNYHAALRERVRLADVKNRSKRYGVFLEETGANGMGMALADRDALRKASDDMYAALEVAVATGRRPKKELDAFVPLLTTTNAKGEQVIGVFDKAIMALNPELDTPEKIEAHALKLKAYFAEEERKAQEAAELQQAYRLYQMFNGYLPGGVPVEYLARFQGQPYDIEVGRADVIPAKKKPFQPQIYF